jgi:hypothetical protein
LSAFEAVPTETPAIAATSASVTRAVASIVVASLASAEKYRTVNSLDRQHPAI